MATKLSSWIPNGQLSYGNGVTARRGQSPVLKGGNNANYFTYVVPLGGCLFRFQDAGASVRVRASILNATGTEVVHDGSLSIGAGTNTRFSYRHPSTDAGKTFRVNVYGEPNKATFQFLGKITCHR